MEPREYLQLETHDFLKDVVIDLHYPTSSKSFRKYESAAETGNPSTGLILKTGFHATHALCLEENFRRTTLAKDNSSLRKQMPRKVQKLHDELHDCLERRSCARFSLVSRTCRRERISARPSTQLFNIPYENIQVLPAAKFTNRVVDRIYIFICHPQSFGMVGYGQGNTRTMI